MQKFINIYCSCIEYYPESEDITVPRSPLLTCDIKIVIFLLLDLAMLTFKHIIFPSLTNYLNIPTF